MRDRGRFVLVMGMTASLAMAGCAGTVRLSSAKMCQAHGGTYNTTTQTCSQGPAARNAKQICEEQGGYYEPALQICEFIP